MVRTPLPSMRFNMAVKPGRWSIRGALVRNTNPHEG
jgi:hypothetical protein